jgi:hypothetical protein
LGLFVEEDLHRKLTRIFQFWERSDDLSECDVQQISKAVTMDEFMNDLFTTAGFHWKADELW